jgi:hypothetical protein
MSSSWNGTGITNTNVTIAGSQNIAIGYSGTSYTIDLKEELVEYIDFAFQVMGIDLSYEDFKKMSDDEKKAFLRDIKINKIL